MQTLYVSRKMNNHHNTNFHKFFKKNFPFIYSLYVSCCWYLLKCNKMINIPFNEVIINDIKIIFMEKSSKSNWWCKITFFTCVDMLPFDNNIYFPLSTITDVPSTLLQVLHPKNFIQLWFSFLVELIAYNPENSIFCLVIVNFMDNSNFSCNSP